MKYIIILAIILALGWYLTFNRLTNANNKINALEGEKNDLIDEIKRRDEYALVLSKQKADLERVAKEDKVNFDWYFDITNSSVVKQLQSNKKRSN